MNRPAILIAGLAVAVISCSPELNPSEAELVERIDLALSDEQPSAQDIVDAFDLPASCGKNSCFFEGSTIAGLTYAKGDLRPDDDGLVFVLEGFGGECIRMEKVASHFGLSAPENTCSDAVCWYAHAQHRWGIVGFEVDRPASKCVSSFVINSLPYQRQEPTVIEVGGRPVCVENCNS